MDNEEDSRESGLSPIRGPEVEDSNYLLTQPNKSRQQTPELEHEHQDVQDEDTMEVDEEEVEAEAEGGRLDFSMVKSFYEFPTMMQDNLHSFNDTTMEDVLDREEVNAEEEDSKEEEVNEDQKVAMTWNKTPPSWTQVQDTLTDHGLFESRTVDQKRFGATFSVKSDADSSAGELVFISCGSHGRAHGFRICFVHF